MKSERTLVKWKSNTSIHTENEPRSLSRAKTSAVFTHICGGKQYQSLYCNVGLVAVPGSFVKTKKTCFYKILNYKKLFRSNKQTFDIT